MLSVLGHEVECEGLGMCGGVVRVGGLDHRAAVRGARARVEWWPGVGVAVELWGVCGDERSLAAACNATACSGSGRGCGRAVGGASP